MSISDKIIRTVDLQKGILPHRLGRLFATGETKGHEFQISVYDGGTPVDLTGATVLGYFTPSGSSSNEVEGGTVSGNTCTISLSAACYTRSGYFEFDIRLTKDGITHTIYYATGYMVTSYNEPIDTTPTKMTLDQIQQKIVDLKNQAKAVEDSIPEDYTELTEHVDFLTDENYEAKSGNDVFEIGAITASTGITEENAKRFRTKDYIDGAVGIRAKDGYKIGLRAYQKNDAKTYVGSWNGTAFAKSGSGSVFLTGSLTLKDFGDYYFKLNVARPTDTKDVTTEDFAYVEILYGVKASMAEVAEIEKGTQDLREVIKPDYVYTEPLEFEPGWSTGFIGYQTGNFSTGSSSIRSTNYIDVSGYTKIAYTAMQLATVPLSKHGMAFYDENKTYISGIPNVYGASEGKSVILTADVPANAVYARFTYYFANSAIPHEEFNIWNAESGYISSGMSDAFINTNDFALTNFANGARGLANYGLYSYRANNYVFSGRANTKAFCISGNPSLPPTDANFSDLPDDYFTIPLESGKTYTLAVFATGQTETGKNISFYFAPKTTKVQESYVPQVDPATNSGTIVTQTFTPTVTDLYAFKIYPRSSEDKTVKVAIYPPECTYQRITALGTSLAGVQTDIDTLTAKDTEIESEIDTLSAQMETAGKLESTGDDTDRTNEILAIMTRHGYCELGEGKFVISALGLGSGMELRGQGYATKLKLLDRGSTAIVVSSNTTIRDLTLIGSDSPISYTSESTIGTKYGIVINLYGYYNVNISNVRISGFDACGIQARGFGPSTTSPVKYVKCNVSNCFIDNCFDGILVSGLTQNACFTNCHCTNGVYGAYISTRCQFANCIFADNLNGVYAENKGPIFTGCLFNDQDTKNEFALVANNVNGYPLMLNGCRFYDCGKLQVKADSGTKYMSLFSGCSFAGMTLPITCNNVAGALFADCLFGADITASGNIEETTAGAVKLKNCYKMDTGALLER